MPLSFDPDWHSDAQDLSGNITVMGINFDDLGGPAGSTGDTIVLFLVSDVAGSNTPVLTAATLRDSGGNDIGDLDVAVYAVGPLDERILALTATRPPDLHALQLLWQSGSGLGDFVYAVGNFPAGTLPAVSAAEFYPYEPPTLEDTISASGSGVFAGVMVTDYDSGPDGPFSVTPTGAGEFADFYVASVSNDYDIIAWAYEGNQPSFDMVGGRIHYAIVLGPAGRRWWAGVGGWT